MGRVFFGRALDNAATYWRVYRRDGAALGFTAHDRDLWFGGLLHRAAPGMLPSAIRRTSRLDDDGAEIEGALSHDSIRAEDLAAGRFDGARIETGIVDWVTLEAAALYCGSIETVTAEVAGFSAQLRAAKADLEIDPVPRSSPTCRARFCGPGCALSPPAFTHRASVTGVDFDANRVSIGIPGPAPFAHGELRWIDGPQTGLSFNVVSASAEGLVLGAAIDPGCAAGMRVSLREGCDHTVATCAGRYGNAANFQGEPFLPGNDLLTRYPVPR